MEEAGEWEEEEEGAAAGEQQWQAAPAEPGAATVRLLPVNIVIEAKRLSGAVQGAEADAVPALDSHFTFPLFAVRAEEEGADIGDASLLGAELPLPFVRTWSQCLPRQLMQAALETAGDDEAEGVGLVLHLQVGRLDGRA